MRIVAFKHPDWTGRIAIVVDKDGGVVPVRLDGVWYRGRLTGRRVDRPRERWYFDGPQHREGVPGLPEWVHLLPASVVVARPPRARVPKKCEDCGCVLARHLGDLELHEPGCSNFPL